MKASAMSHFPLANKYLKRKVCEVLPNAPHGRSPPLSFQVSPSWQQCQVLLEPAEGGKWHM